MSATLDPRFEALTPTERLRMLTAVFAMVAVFSMGLGLSAPLIAISMDSLGASRTEIGINTAIAALAILAVAPSVPRLLRRFGTRLVVAVALALSTGVLLLFKASEGALALWYPLRFLFTAGIAAVFVASESLINQLATPGARGRLLGLYTTAMSGGFAIGAFILSGLGSAGVRPFLVGAGLLLLGAVATGITPLLDRARCRTSGADPVKGLTRGHMLAMSAAVIFGAIEFGGAALLPVYALRLGLSEAVAALSVTSLALGYIALPLVTGMLGDRYGTRPMLAATTAATLLTVALMPLTTHSLPLFLCDVFLVGGASAGLYVLGLAALVEKLEPDAIAPANAAFISAYGVGALAGPLACGIAMDLYDPHGLVATLAIVLGAYLLGLVAARRPMARDAAIDRTVPGPH